MIGILPDLGYMLWLSPFTEPWINFVAWFHQL